MESTKRHPSPVFVSNPRYIFVRCPFLWGAYSRCSLRTERPSLLEKKRAYYRTHVNALHCCVEQPEWKNYAIDKDVANNSKLVALETLLDEAWYCDDESRVKELRAEIGKLQATSYVDILSANLKFYNAFSRGSTIDMASCWLQDSNVMCKHPMGPMFTGFWKVMESFEAMFYAGLANIRPVNVRISVRGSIALVTCEEHANPTDERNDEKRSVGNKWNENFSFERAEIRMAATNIFEKKNGQFYIIYHVSSPINPIT